MFLGRHAMAGLSLLVWSAAAQIDETTRAEMERAAVEGSTDAMLELGFYYDQQGSTESQRAAAAYWYQRAADSGVAIAHLRLGQQYETGDGVTQSYEGARRHYEAAISLGLVRANFSLAFLPLEGWGVPRDPARCAALIALAAEAGHGPAQDMMSDLLVAGIGVKRDLAAALAWALRAARSASPEADLKVGSYAERGLGMMRDVKAAREWYRLSADADYSRGMLALSMLLLGPESDPGDRELGLRWLELAADRGSASAVLVMASLAARDPAKASEATELLLKASRMGEPQAMELLEWLYIGHSLSEAFERFTSNTYEDR